MRTNCQQIPVEYTAQNRVLLSGRCAAVLNKCVSLWKIFLTNDMLPFSRWMRWSSGQLWWDGISWRKSFWKYVEDPITTAIFVSAMWNGLSRFCREPELEKDIRIWGKEFGAMGMDVLNMAYKESIDRAFDLLDREFPDFGRRTPVQLAYDARNR